MAGNQYGGWSSSVNAANLQPADAFSRIMLMRYGGRTDNLFDYRDESGYKTSLGAAHYYSGEEDSKPRKFMNSGNAPRSFGGGSTPSDPGGYNWGTFEDNLNRIGRGVGNLVNFRMENQRYAKAKQAKSDADFLNNAHNTYLNTYDPTRNYYAAYTQAAGSAFNKPPASPGLSLTQSQQTADQLKNQYFGVGPIRKQSRNPAVQSPKKKSTAPKINPPKLPGA